MDEQTLIKHITSQVLEQLAQAKQPPAMPVEKQQRILAVFTGGTIGLEQALTELAILGQQAVIDVVLSKAAEDVVGADKVRPLLGAGSSLITACSPYPGQLLRSADVVVVPVLTQNTASKLAHAFSDSLPATIILQALMLGKPVIAAVNAADPQNSWRVEHQMTKSVPALMQALQSNLVKIAAFGIELVDADRLAAAVRRSLAPKQVNMAAAITVTGKKSLVDAAAVEQAAQTGAKSLPVAAGALVTPLAVDTARQYGIVLEYASAADGQRKDG